MNPHPCHSASRSASAALLSRLPFLLLGLVAALPVAAQVPTQPAAGLISNGDFEAATQEANWPDFWSHPKAGSSSWELEEGKHYLRINATAPGETVLIYRVIPLPPGAKALELSLRARVIGLKCGPQPWFDARIMTDFKGATGTKIKGAKAINFRKDTDGWIERKVRFAVPEGAVAIEIMPTLFQTYSGTFDIDALQLTPIDPSQINPAPVP